MAKAFGVSVIVTSAVIKRLGAEGLVRARPHLGSVVVPRDVKLWCGTVLFVNAGGAYSAYASLLSAALRDAFVAAGYLFIETDMPSRFIGRDDLSRLSMHQTPVLRLVVMLHTRPEIEKPVAASCVPHIVIAGGAAPVEDCARAGIVHTDYSLAIDDLVHHCQAAGVKNVLEVGFERGYASALLGLVRIGVRVPEEVRVVSLATKGFEPMWWSPVTRLEWNWTSVGERIAGRALAWLDGKAVSADDTIRPDYIVGETFPHARRLTALSHEVAVDFATWFIERV